MSFDPHEFVRAASNRINSDGSFPDKKTFKALLEGRNNEKILDYLNNHGQERMYFEVSGHFISRHMFYSILQYAVLQLTCNNDAHTLESILDWGAKMGFEVTWDDEKSEPNPVMVASQQNYLQCTKLLHRYGYRIPQIRGDAFAEGVQEMLRMEHVSEEPHMDEEDHVEKFLAFQAYTKPHYLSLAFTEEDRIDNPDISDEDLKDLEKLDPLKRAFDLAELADNLSVEIKGMSELKGSYSEIRNHLEMYTRGILTQCSNMDEVKVILEHKFKTDDSEEEGKSLESNFQKSLLDGRKEFVSHPFYQQYLWKQMTGDSTHEYRHRMKHCRLWTFVYVLEAIFLFSLYPFIAFADFFRKADILFVSKRRTMLENGNLEPLTVMGRIFMHFRLKIHTPFFRMIVFCAIQFAYLILLIVTIWDPINEMEREACEAMDDDTGLNVGTVVDKGKKNVMGGACKSEERDFKWYTILAVVLTVFFIIEDTIEFIVKGKHKTRSDFFETFWIPFSLVGRTFILVGSLVAYAYFQTNPNNRNRANLSGNDMLNFGYTVVSIGIAAEFFKQLRFLILFEYLGPLVICLIVVIRDAMKVCMVYAIIFGTFGIAGWSLLKPFQTEDAMMTTDMREEGFNGTRFSLASEDQEAGTKRSLFQLFMWRMLSPAESNEQMFIKENKFWFSHGLHNSTHSLDGSEHEILETEDFSMSISHLALMFVWVGYQIAVAIFMLNLLIAIMNNTYSEVYQSADKIWKYSKSYYQVSHNYSS